MKKILNEELSRIREIFSHLNIEIPIISEGRLGRYLGNGFEAINPSSTVSKLLGTESTTAIENSLINASKNSPAIMKQLGKDIQSNISIEDLKTAFKETSGSNLATQIIKQMTPEESTKLIDNVSNYILTTNLSKNLKSISSSNELLNNFKNTVSSEITTQQAQRILDNIQSYRNAINNLTDLKLKENWLNAVDLAEVQANTTLLKNELPNTLENSSNINVSDPQSYLDGLSETELWSKLNNSYSWLSNGIYPELVGGWKFHIYADDLKDMVFLKEKLWPVAQKWNAEAKVGGSAQLNSPKFKKGEIQHGKQGVTMYIPVDVVNNGLQKQMLSDIETAIYGYTKGGTINGDNMITPAIHYRYDFLGPVPQEGIPRKYAGEDGMYRENDGGLYKPNDVDDIFETPSSLNQNVINNSNFLTNSIGDTSLIDWTKIQNAKNVNDYNILINQALDTGNFDYISRGGFESYDIPDFRQYVKDKYIEKQGLTGNPGNPVKISKTNGPSNWSDYQPPNYQRSPYERYGSGSN